MRLPISILEKTEMFSTWPVLNREKGQPIGTQPAQSKTANLAMIGSPDVPRLLVVSRPGGAQLSNPVSNIW